MSSRVFLTSFDALPQCSASSYPSIFHPGIPPRSETDDEEEEEDWDMNAKQMLRFSDNF